MVHSCISASCVLIVLAGRHKFFFKGILPVPDEEDAAKSILRTSEKYR